MRPLWLKRGFFLLFAADGLPPAHQFVLILQGGLRQGWLEVVEVRFANDLRWLHGSQILSLGPAHENKRPLPVLEVNPVRNVLQQAVEQLVVLLNAA